MKNNIKNNNFFFKYINKKINNIIKYLTTTSEVL